MLGVVGLKRKRIGKMWKLKIGEGGKELISANNFVGRQHWVFDPNAGTIEERREVERLRHQFTLNRHSIKQSSDLFLRMQVLFLASKLLNFKKKNIFSSHLNIFIFTFFSYKKIKITFIIILSVYMSVSC